MDLIQITNNWRLKYLSYQDRWAFVVFLGYSQEGYEPLLNRPGLALRLGVDVSMLDAIADRLVQAGLIESHASWRVKSSVLPTQT